MPDTTPRLNDTDNTLLKKICLLLDGAIPSGVLSFNARTGAVTLLLADVTALVDSRYVLKSGDTMTGALTVQGTLSGRTNTSTTGGMVMNTDDSATNFAYQFLIQKRGATGDATAAVVNTAELGALAFRAWNGSAYVTGAQIVARAAQNQSVGNSGAILQFTTTPIGGASSFVRVIISAPGNILLSNVLATEPASLVGGLVWKDGTAASADPTTGSAMWSISGALQYRTSGANDGSGRAHHLHNRSTQQAGVGTDYSLTNSTAQVNFGTTNAAVTLPTVGRYLVQANVSIIDGAGTDDIYNAKLRNTTDGVDLGVNKKVSGGTASGRRFNIFLSQIVDTTVSNTVVQIFAHNETAVRGTIESTTTDMSYVRLS